MFRHLKSWRHHPKNKDDFMEFHQIILKHEKTNFLRPKSDHPGVIPASISGELEQLTLHPVIILSCIASPPPARRVPASVAKSLDRAG